MISPIWIGASKYHHNRHGIDHRNSRAKKMRAIIQSRFWMNRVTSTPALVFRQAQIITENLHSCSVIVSPMGRFLGRPLGFPDVPLTKRVAMPASCSLSYRPADVGCKGKSGWKSSSIESVMIAPELIEWSLQISTLRAAIDHLNPHDKNMRRASVDVVR